MTLHINASQSQVQMCACHEALMTSSDAYSCDAGFAEEVWENVTQRFWPDGQEDYCHCPLFR